MREWVSVGVREVERWKRRVREWVSVGVWEVEEWKSGKVLVHSDQSNNQTSKQFSTPHNCTKRILAENQKLAVIEVPRRHEPDKKPIGKRRLP